MIVWSLAVPANELVVVSPVNVIALVIARELVQLAFPPGIITMSPSTAEPMAWLTSKKEGVRAVMLFACAAPEAAKSSAARSALSFLPFRAVTLGAEVGSPYRKQRELYTRARQCKVERWIDQLVPMTDTVKARK